MGKLANLLFFVVGSSKVRIVILKICLLGLIVHFWVVIILNTELSGLTFLFLCWVIIKCFTDYNCIMILLH